MARHSELGIKYNASQPQLTLDQIASKALTYQVIESGLPGASGWYKTLRDKSLMFLVDVVLDAYSKYGRDKLISLINKTGLDINTSKFIIKLLEKFTVFLTGTKSFKDAKEQTINAVIAQFSSFITESEKVDFTLAINKGTDEQVAEAIKESVKEKADEVQQKWHVQHTESSKRTDEEDINETVIPELETQVKTPKDSGTTQTQPATTSNSQISSNAKAPDNTGMIIAVTISIATLLGFLAFVIYTVNKKGKRRRR